MWVIMPLSMWIIMHVSMWIPTSSIYKYQTDLWNLNQMVWISQLYHIYKPRVWDKALLNSARRLWPDNFLNNLIHIGIHIDKYLVIRKTEYSFWNLKNKILILVYAAQFNLVDSIPQVWAIHYRCIIGILYIIKHELLTSTCLDGEQLLDSLEREVWRHME